MIIIPATATTDEQNGKSPATTSTDYDVTTPQDDVNIQSPAADAAAETHNDVTISTASGNDVTTRNDVTTATTTIFSTKQQPDDEQQQVYVVLSLTVTSHT